MLNLETLWLERGKWNLRFFSSLISGNSCIITPQFRKQVPCTPPNTKLVVTTGIARVGLEAKFLLLNNLSCGIYCPNSCVSPLVV